MNIEQFILSSLENIGQTNFDMLLKGLGVIFILFWLAVVYWAWVDSGERTTNLFFRILSTFIVLVFSVPGLIVYNLVKPKATIEEIYWADLERRYLKFETSELTDCPKCATQLFPGFIVCPMCGENLKVKCSKCNSYLEKKWKSCPYCGEKQNVTSEKLDGSLTEVESSVEAMETVVEETKQEIQTAVKENKIRYPINRGIFTNLLTKITSVIKFKPKQKRETESQKTETVEMKETLFKKKEKKKSKKKR